MCFLRNLLSSFIRSFVWLAGHGAQAKAAAKLFQFVFCQAAEQAMDRSNVDSRGASSGPEKSPLESFSMVF